MSNFTLDRFLPYQISVIARRLSHELEERYSRQFGLSVSEWRIMAHLSQSSPVSVRELVSRVDMHKSRVSRACHRMEAAGWVSSVTNTADRRLKDLELTPKGKQMMSELTPLVNGYQRELLLRLEEHQDGFLKGVELLLRESS